MGTDSTNAKFKAKSIKSTTLDANPGTEITFRPIGVLKSEFKQKFGTPRQGSLAQNCRAHIQLAPEWRGRGIFSGLEGFSHVWLMTHLHLSLSKRTRGKVHPPRLKGKKVGVLASRSPHRPNNLGLTLARVKSCDGDQLELTEVDLVDGTPILDIKPYVAQADRPKEFTCGWVDQLNPDARAIDFTKDAIAELHRLIHIPDEQKRLQSLIEEMISHDPRPPAYWGKLHAQFHVWVAGLNVEFHFHNERFTVTGVTLAAKDDKPTSASSERQRRTKRVKPPM